MRLQERGIGNLAFIAVLVLFVIALAMFFVAQDEADTAKQKATNASKEAATARQAVVDAQNSYDALLELTGLTADEFRRSGDAFPDPEKIKAAGRKWLVDLTNQIKQSGELTLSTRNYQVPQGGAKVQVVEGDKARLQLYDTTLGPETINLKGVLEPLPGQFAYAAKIARENNDKFETTVETMRGRIQQLQESLNAATSQYQNDVASQQSQAEGFQQQLSQTRDQFQAQTAKVDGLESELAQTKSEFSRKLRAVERERDAWRSRAINEKVKKELALEEDPEDGEVIEASGTLGTVWINRGRKHRVSRGTKFTVWQPGKGDIRQDIAVIRVIDVGETRSEARIVKKIDARRPVTRGMSISNPFYDPTRPLKVFIYGDLRRYTTDIAKRRLAASGVIVADKLDDSVNVIVLGTPPTGGAVVEDEEDAAAAERMRSIEIDRRLKEVMDTARGIGAIVVTEDVLATFIDY